MVYGQPGKVKKEHPEGGGHLGAPEVVLRTRAEVLGESAPPGDSGVLKETPRHWSPYGASDNPPSPNITANVTLKLDVLLLAFGPKPKEM
ncbi:hypothetical protein PF002_g32004 [Phytophthora fragariae]|uniref:Uncharacterized protein n=1 Tax=Phytophthora fragariae TaxID=53985 RepID=A0A6A3LNF3_9STRA|nr:hypothetical protein PF011_g5130 [Phytophthora fragariae]KAE9162849.1 hypothetical protein PF002_g32004 [Phytophthora fragariae]KAE9208717.1 hypothetical protein PF004_g16683 [Phytophthora fragariae]